MEEKMNARNSRWEYSIGRGKLEYKKPVLAKIDICEISSEELKKLDNIFNYMRK